MRLNTNSPDYHEYIVRRDARFRIKVRNIFIRLFRPIKHAFTHR